MIDNKLSNTEQTMRMKQLVVDDNYSNCDEIYSNKWIMINM